MLVPISWLKEFVPFTVPVEVLAEDLTMAGLEVEGMCSARAHLDSVVAGFVKDVNPHPSESRLRICTVELGEEDAVVIVCGAPNVAQGQWVAVAKPGTELPGGKAIKAASIHGVSSEGMICSEVELGIGEDHSGILVLQAQGLKAGTPLSRVLDIDDWILEIGITPNRPDCLSIYGVAREVAALYGLPLSGVPLEENHGAAAAPAECPVTIVSQEDCFRYAGAVLDNIRIAPSPAWMQQRLLACGVRPINNVVDVTNYVLLEVGQPLHAFDLDRLTGPAIVVRHAEPGEKLVTLDGKSRDLDPAMLVIADSERPVAVAGVMGGEASEVRDDTQRIFLESAWFNPPQVRRTARALKLSTEASYRFERGVDPLGIDIALRRAIRLLCEVAGARFDGAVQDVNAAPYEERSLALRSRRVKRILGIELPASGIADILKRIGMDLTQVEEAQVSGTTPSFRQDLKEEIDLIEEIARLHGFPNIPTRMPRAELVLAMEERGDVWTSRIRRFFVAQGFTEAISYSFVSPQDVQALGFAANDPRLRLLPLQNPLTDEMSVMRTSLLPSLLGAVSRNQAHRNMDLRVFETGKVFYARKPGEQPDEERRIAALWTGRRHPALWCWSSDGCDLFDLKGVLEELLRGLGLAGWAFTLGAHEDPFLLPGSAAQVTSAEGAVLGSIGQMEPEVLAHWNLDGPVFALDLSIEALMRVASDLRTFHALPKFPAVERDVAIILADSIASHDIVAFIRGQSPAYLDDVAIFDVYRGKPIPKEAKSVGLRLRYRAMDHTLTDDEVTRIHDPLVQEVLGHFHGELRS